MDYDLLAVLMGKTPTTFYLCKPQGKAGEEYLCRLLALQLSEMVGKEDVKIGTSTPGMQKLVVCVFGERQ